MKEKCEITVKIEMTEELKEAIESFNKRLNKIEQILKEDLR